MRDGVRLLGFLPILLALALACGESEQQAEDIADASETAADAGREADVTVVETFDVAPFNEGLEDNIPTVDVAFYITEGGPLEWDDLATSIDRAQQIFGEVGVQIRVSSALKIQIPADWQRLDPDDVSLPSTPDFLETDLYAHLDELKSRPSTRNRSIFEAITFYFPETAGASKANTVHIITVDEAPIAYYEWSGSEWTYETAPTGGLSFPPYAYSDRIPEPIRGVITLSYEQPRFFPETRTLSHELGHKLINVSHEGVGVCPAFAADGPELMLYGNGELIPAGAEGRWHQERLLLSPFLYTKSQGDYEYPNIFQAGGIYTDPLYGSYIIDPVCPASAQ
tara:strand:- start:3119 stop:4135 length:1017 start_codon:yes stop_codon:yes gene_type:complete